MPVEIRELVIRAVAIDKSEDAEDGSQAESPLLSGSMDGTDAIVQECVRQVLRILRKEKER
jgi:hypothetical protein